MLRIIYRSITVTLILGSVLCGVYPLLVWGIGNLLFPDKATGGIILRNGQPIGAKLIGQSFKRPEYFHGRPSAAGEKGYDASNSSGSNLGPTHQKFKDQLQANVDQFLKENPQIKKGQVPADSVTASASGLDPHISPESAFAQTFRIAQTRQVSIDQINSLVQERIEGPLVGIFGEPVVHVLKLNLELDQRFPLIK